MSDGDKNKDKHSELIMDEFLFKTIVSLQVTLSTIGKDLEQKTDLLHDVTDSLTAITYNMKEVRDKLDKKDGISKDFQSGIDELGKRIQLIEVKFESDNSMLEGHVKEMKYSIQEILQLVIELKTEKKIRSEGAVDKIPPKAESKFDFFELLTKTWEAIKNIKTIFYIILILGLVIVSLVGGSSFFTEFIKIIKTLLKG